MRYALSANHYAALWGKTDNSLEDVTNLGIRYAELPDCREKEDVLLEIIQCFHSYVLKYVDMILRGHLPTYRGHVNQDSVNFLCRFMRSGEAGSNLGMLQGICRTMHVAFKNESYDEVYNILAGLLVKVIHSYDPKYTDKIKLVAEAIDRLQISDEVILGPELDLDFDPGKYLRWMTRKGILVAVRDPEDKLRRIVGFQLAAWPPAPALLNAKPIGLAYHIHRWFGSHLQTYITRKMKEVEVVDGMMQLDHRAVRWVAQGRSVKWEN